MICLFLFIYLKQKWWKVDIVMLMVQPTSQDVWRRKSFNHLISVILIDEFLFLNTANILENLCMVPIYHIPAGCNQSRKYSSPVFFCLFWLLDKTSGYFRICGWNAQYCGFLLTSVLLGKIEEGQMFYHGDTAVSFFSFCCWAVTQPSNIDGSTMAQGDFLKDLYAENSLPHRKTKKMLKNKTTIIILVTEEVGLLISIAGILDVMMVLLVIVLILLLSLHCPMHFKLLY